MARPDSKWYKLDSAGILYSALQKEEYSAIYRFSARMEGEVDPAALQRAIDRCMPVSYTHLDVYKRQMFFSRTGKMVPSWSTCAPM